MRRFLPFVKITFLLCLVSIVAPHSYADDSESEPVTAEEAEEQACFVDAPGCDESEVTMHMCYAVNDSSGLPFMICCPSWRGEICYPYDGRVA